MADSTEIQESIYEECDFYIKRMLLKEDYNKKEKLVPYGLNYSVFYENRYLQNLIYKKNFFKYSVRYHPTLSRILNMKNSIGSSHLKKLQASPKEDFGIVFRSRLWNPENNPTDWKKEERKKMNRDRIEINKILKEQYGDLFSSGIEKDEFSEKECPELLIPDKEYHKANYLKKLKNVSVGIITEGLEKSIGWKLGEYVAHSMAILTSPIDEFQLPGDFREGANYLVFKSQQELLKKIRQLYNDSDLRMEIQQNNQEYYNEYLEPAAKLQKIFIRINEKA
ncbi:hypothetical protein C7S20_00270 [Christiangramia fulva]|uniref:Glycosyltransferase n=2 Tax=Christiangramia fulva TaxID=2126553 RepID=A0A2R3Z0N6_9FLAO|nr:hypothetical protein C7S20_00270 [Christiangramia fulva]